MDDKPNDNLLAEVACDGYPNKPEHTRWVSFIFRHAGMKKLPAGVTATSGVRCPVCQPDHDFTHFTGRTRWKDQT